MCRLYYRFALLACVCLAVLATSAPAAVIRVKWDSPADGPGDTWANAYRTVTAAIAASAAGDEIWVAGDASHWYAESIILKDGVGLYGGFAGGETTRDQRDWNTNVTILDGGGNRRVVTPPSGATATTVLDGFTIRNGWAGIYCDSSSPTITNSTIVRNDYYGICCDFSSPAITNNTILGNGVTGISCGNSSPTITNNTITGHGEDGIYCGNSSPTITNNTISGNSTGISCASSSPTIMNNTISGNSTGISCSFSSPALTNNTIAGNAGTGIYCRYSSAPTITNNTIAGSGQYGIYCDSSDPSIMNNIVAFNGTGIYKSGGTPVLGSNCVFNPDGTDYRGLSAGASDITVDPRLESAAYGKLHIQPDSPCVDAGMDSAVEAGWKDMDGQARIQGPHVDIGADESDGTVWPAYVPVAVRVSPEGDDANDGSTWALAKRTVQAGIDAAKTVGGDVWVAAGVYNERITLPSYVYLYGGFAGSESSRGECDWGVNTTVLDAGGDDAVVTASGGHRLSAIDGFTIRNGKYGIYCNSSSPSVTNNMISGNDDGIYCQYSSSPTITNNTISGNRRGISCDSSSPWITNNAIAGSGQYGISCLSSNPTITNNTIAANSYDGIYCHDSSPSITNNAIAGNGWAGIYCQYSSSPSITNNTIAGNSRGIYCYSASSFLITNNTIAGNGWAGIYCQYSASPTITNNTISGNGDGIHSNSSSPSITNNIVAFNATGILNYGASGTPVLKYNCVFNPDGTNYDSLTAGTGDISEDPLFVNRTGGDFHISPMSPCINAGLDTAVGDGWRDMDGQPRVLGAHVDIGADEFLAAGVAAARAAAGAPVALPAMPVTAAWQDVFYVEQPDRACGIRVERAAHGLTVGQSATIAGQVALASNGEVSVLAESVAAEGTGGVEPVIVRNVNLGGAGNGLQPAIGGSLGLNNIGLLVTTAGTVFAPRVQSGWFYVDDGSGVWDGTGVGGIYVDATGLLAPPAGSFAAVTGISSCEWYDGNLVNVLRPRSQVDISFWTHASASALWQDVPAVNPRTGGK